MDRRQFLTGTLALAALAGCSRVAPPPEPGVTRTPTPSATPTPTPPATRRPVAAGVTTAELAMQAVAMKSLDARGYAGVAAGMPANGVYGLSAAVKGGSVAFAVGFAMTLLDSVSAVGDPPAPDELLPTLASALEPDGVGLLQQSPADGHLVWVTGPQSSLAALDALSDGKKRSVSVPSFVVERADGVPALKDVYGANLTVTTDDDPRSRHDAVLAGKVDLTVFRACDVAELVGLRELEDSSGIVRPDPMILAFDAQLTDADPGAVLAITDALTALGVDGLGTLEAAIYAAGDLDADTIVTKWVSQHLPPG